MEPHSPKIEQNTGGGVYRSFAVRLAVFVAFAWTAVAAGQGVPDGPDGGPDRDAPDFVRASLLLASPGEVLYSCAGHAALRLECPAHGLDLCFTYESESARDKIRTFLAGKLKMGMFAVPTAEYLASYRSEGRGATQWPLALTPAAERALWRILDEKVAEGANLPSTPSRAVARSRS